MDPKEVKPDITREDIAVLVAAFYADVRNDPRLGPIFAEHVGHDDKEWTRHVATIEAFWGNVMLRDRAYQGNPMQAHMRVPEIVQGDFAIWLDLFEETARTVLPDHKASAFATLARRIGRSLSMGLEVARNQNRPPNLHTGTSPRQNSA